MSKKPDKTLIPYEGMFKKIYKQWEKKWLTEKNEAIARIYNKLMRMLAAEKAHIDDAIVVLQIVLQELTVQRIKFINAERAQQAKTGQIGSKIPLDEAVKRGLLSDKKAKAIRPAKQKGVV